MVEVTRIIPRKSLGIFAENELSGTMAHIDNAVEKIKAVLSEQ